MPQKEGSAPPRLTRGLRAIAYDDPPIHSMIYIISPSHSRAYPTPTSTYNPVRPSALREQLLSNANTLISSWCEFHLSLHCYTMNAFDPSTPPSSDRSRASSDASSRTSRRRKVTSLCIRFVRYVRGIDDKHVYVGNVRRPQVAYVPPPPYAAVTT